MLLPRQFPATTGLIFILTDDFACYWESYKYNQAIHTICARSFLSITFWRFSMLLYMPAAQSFFLFCFVTFHWTPQFGYQCCFRVFALVDKHEWKDEAHVRIHRLKLRKIPHFDISNFSNCDGLAGENSLCTRISGIWIVCGN